MHYLGKRVEAWATLPDGSEEPLLRIDDWDFNWQDEYRYEEPIHLPAGTQLRVRFHLRQFDRIRATRRFHRSRSASDRRRPTRWRS